MEPAELSFLVLVERAELDPETFVAETENAVAQVLRTFCEEQGKELCWGSFGFCNREEFAAAYKRGISSDDKAIVAKGLSGPEADSVIKALSIGLRCKKASACKRFGCGRATWDNLPNGWCHSNCRDLAAEHVALCKHWECRKPTWNKLRDEWCSTDCKRRAEHGFCTAPVAEAADRPCARPVELAGPVAGAAPGSAPCCAGPAPAPPVAVQPQPVSEPRRGHKGGKGGAGPAPAPPLRVDLPPGTHELCGELNVRIYDDLATNENGVKDWAASVHTAVIGVTERVIGGENLVFVVFRGTATVLDWQKNLDCTHVARGWAPYGVRVHKGFWEELEQCIKHIFEKLLDLCRARPARRRLVLTGHSQGGGMAMILHAHLWKLRHDAGLPREVSQVPQMMDMFVMAECVAIAGPMVFAPIKWCHLDDDARGKFREMTEFLSETTVDYMLKDDPVPRAFAGVEIEKTLEVAGLWVRRQLRIMWGVGVGIGGLVAIVAPIGGLVLAGVLGGVVAPFSLTKLHRLRKSIDEQLANSESLSQFQQFGYQYRHCAKIRCLRRKDLPWTQFEVGLTGFYNHGSVGYSNELTKRVSKGMFHEFNEEFSIDCGSCIPSHHASVYVPPDIWCQYYQEAKEGNWDNVLQKLRQAPLGTINDIIIVQAGQQRAWHFIHQAAFLAKRDIIVELLSFGADPARLTKDGKDLEAVAKEGESSDEQFLIWLHGITSRAQSLRNAGVQMLEASQLLAVHLDSIGDDEVLEPLSHEEFAQLVHQNLRDCGYTDKLIQSGAVHDETFEQADHRIRSNQGADGLRRDMKVHLFLDAAKYRQFPTMRRMLVEATPAGEPALANARISPPATPAGEPALANASPWLGDSGEERGLRWSAAMQLAYVGAPMEEISFVLSLYPCLSSLRAVAEEMSEVEAGIAREQSGAPVPGPAKRGAPKRGAANPVAGVVAVRRLVTRVGQLAAQSGETNVQALVSRALNNGD